MVQNTNEIETVCCNLCNSNDYELYMKATVQPYQIGQYKFDEWNYVRCKSCGLIFENPRPDKKTLKDYYNFNVKEDINYVEDWFISNSDHHRKTWRRYLRIIHRYIQSGNLLDVGCGAGSFIQEAMNYGFEGIGQEISPFFIEYCQKQGIPVTNQEVESIPFPKESFDLITSFDVIEHHTDPKSLVLRIHTLLKKNGTFVLTTHDIGNIFARIYGKNWRHVYPIGHITFFTKNTIIKLLRDCGFEVKYFEGVHTADSNFFLTSKNYIIQFIKLIILRAFVIYIYKPLSEKINYLQKWNFTIFGNSFSHKDLLMRSSNQIIMNDSFICIAKKT